MDSAEDTMAVDAVETTFSGNATTDVILNTDPGDTVTAEPTQASTQLVSATATNIAEFETTNGEGSVTGAIVDETASEADGLHVEDGSGSTQRTSESSQPNESLAGDASTGEIKQWRCHMKNCWGNFRTEKVLHRHLDTTHPDHEAYCDIKWESCPLEECDFKYSQWQVKLLHEHLEKHGVEMVFKDDQVVIYDAENQAVTEVPMGEEHENIADPEGPKRISRRAVVAARARNRRASGTPRGNYTTLDTTENASSDVAVGYESDEPAILEERTVVVEEVSEEDVQSSMSLFELYEPEPEYREEEALPTPSPQTNDAPLHAGSETQPSTGPMSLEGHPRSHSIPPLLQAAAQYPDPRKRQRATYGAVGQLSQYRVTDPVRPELPSGLPQPPLESYTRPISNPLRSLSSPLQLALLNLRRSTYGFQTLLSQQHPSGPRRLSLAAGTAGPPHWQSAPCGQPLQSAAFPPQMTLDSLVEDGSPSFRSMDGQRVRMGTAQPSPAVPRSHAPRGLSSVQESSMQTVRVGTPDYRAVIAQMINQKAKHETEDMRALPWIAR